jgi:hypothetical protein
MGGATPEIAQSGWGVVRVGFPRFAWANNAASSTQGLDLALRWVGPLRPWRGGYPPGAAWRSTR